MFVTRSNNRNSINPSEYVPEVTDESEYDDSPLISGATAASALPGKCSIF